MPSTATTRTVTGLTNGTAYQFRVAAVNGIGTGAYSTASSAVTPTAGDPFFSSVSLLLHFDGDGTTITDSSATPKTVATGPNGASFTQSATQSRFGGKSIFFNTGSAGNIQAAVGATPVGTEDFTIEFWHWYDAANNPFNYGQDIVCTSTAYDGSVIPFVIKTKGINVNGTDVISFGSPVGNQWYHAALVRQSNVFRFYRDGVQVDSGSSSASLSATLLYIGSLPFYASSGSLGSYIDELRITRGVVRYPDGTTFTPPTAAFLNS